MNKNPLLGLESFGQSVWLDFLRRNALDNGDIQRLIEQDGVSGLTSNPSIFEKAIAGSHDYDNAIRSMALEAYRALEGLHQAGIDLDALTQELEDEGVTKFSQAFEQLMAALQVVSGMP
jgi:transaldolase